MTKRPIKIQQPAPARLPYAVIPIGMFCNQKLQKAQIGDVVQFCHEYRRDKRIVTNICRFRINTPEFTFMLRSICGEEMTIAKLFERWEAWAVVEGIGASGFSRDEALLVEVKEVEE